jgi:hypothetical protein
MFILHSVISRTRAVIYSMTACATARAVRHGHVTTQVGVTLYVMRGERRTDLSQTSFDFPLLVTTLPLLRTHLLRSSVFAGGFNLRPVTCPVRCTELGASNGSSSLNFSRELYVDRKLSFSKRCDVFKTPIDRSAH